MGFARQRTSRWSHSVPRSSCIFWHL